jgi:hypothetical protein
MTFAFKLSRRLAQGWGVIMAASALAACAGERSILDPTPPDTTHTTQPPPPPTSHAGYYAATSGTSAGDGSQSRPWDLATALAGGGGRVQPGDTIWVRAGTYYAPFRSTVSGNATAPVVIRAYPRERAVIDGVNAPTDNFVVAGSYTILWGLEFMNSTQSRTTSIIDHTYRTCLVINNGPHNKYINLVLHDGGVAFYTYSNQADLEVYGSIIYNNGWQAPDRGHGHALYLKNDVGPLVVRDNVIFNQYGYGIHVYSNVGDGLLNNIRLEGNVSFDNGALASTGTSANLGNLGQPLANNLRVVGNMTYMAPSLSGANFALGSGVGLTATDNYVVGGDGLTEGTWTGTVVKTTNTVLAALRTTGTPTVFVRANAYERGRANVVVYNWTGQNSVSVSMAGVLSAGDRYEVHNVQDLNGAAVASGTFSGGSITLPTTGVQPPAPVGVSSSPAPRTGPDFDVFIVTKL